MATVELQFGALALHVRTARLIAAAIARRVGVEESLIDEVKLAVGEACSRAVDVHQAHDPDQLVTVLFDDAEDVFSISVLDVGPPLDQLPDEAAGSRPSVGDMIDTELLDSDLLDAPPPDEPEAEVVTTLPPGIGLALIEGLVDDVSIRPRTDGSGTCVRMSWPTLGDLLLPDTPAD